MSHSKRMPSALASIVNGLVDLWLALWFACVAMGFVVVVLMTGAEQVRGVYDVLPAWSLVLLVPALLCIAVAASLRLFDSQPRFVKHTIFILVPLEFVMCAAYRWAIRHVSDFTYDTMLVFDAKVVGWMLWIVIVGLGLGAAYLLVDQHQKTKSGAAREVSSTHT